MGRPSTSHRSHGESHGEIHHCHRWCSRRVHRCQLGLLHCARGFNVQKSLLYKADIKRHFLLDARDFNPGGHLIVSSVLKSQF